MDTSFLSTYPAKLMEYGLAAGYLALFVPFWKYTQGGRRNKARIYAHAGWFTVPDDVLLHPGHTWARMRADGLVDVGLDDFAARMIGPIERIEVPRKDTVIDQGAAAIFAADHEHKVALAAPVSGKVVKVHRHPHWQEEPYDAGWLFTVEPLRADDADRLLRGEAARRWVEQACVSVASRVSPSLGELLQDGGTPVHGIARELSPDRWDEICRDYFGL